MRKSRRKRSKGPKKPTATEESSTETQSTSDSLHTPRDGNVTVDLEQVRSRFSHLGITAERRTAERRTAMFLSPSEGNPGEACVVPVNEACAVSSTTTLEFH